MRMRRPPRPILQVIWHLHRFFFRLSGQGLEAGTAEKLGTLALRTTGRKSGERRETLVWYMLDPPNLVLVASNAGSDRHPGWWLNLEANPLAHVRVDGDWRPVRARRASGEELTGLWPRLEALSASYRAYRAAAKRDIPVVILEPLGDADRNG